MSFKNMPPEVKYAYVHSPLVISTAEWEEVKPYLMRLAVLDRLQKILKKKLPYFLTYGSRDPYPWVTYRCRHIAEKGRRRC